MLNYGYSVSHGGFVLTTVNIKTFSRNRRYYPGTRMASPSERFIVETAVADSHL